MFLAPDAFANQPQADATAPNTSQPYSGSAAFAFMAALLCFTPTNLVFVTLLAGFLGGCASNIVAENLDVDQLRQVHPRRLMYLEETPWSAMMRSFIVYLCVIAGLYFAMDDPFKDPLQRNTCDWLERFHSWPLLWAMTRRGSSNGSVWSRIHSRLRWSQFGTTRSGSK